MPSVFPGMDPYIEGQVWPGFHSQFVAQLQRVIAPMVRPRYATYIEEHIYLRREPDGARGRIRPDVFVVESRRPRPGSATRRGGVGVLDPPALLPLPHEDSETQTYLEVRRRDSGSVVCVIEVLSPINKQIGPGRDEYVAKRTAVHRSMAHLVELDLLRDGARLPMDEPLPPAAYYALVARTEQWPQCGVWSVGLRERLPQIPIPLADGDPDVVLDLQAVFDDVYDAAEYAYTLDYELPPEPALSPEDAAWARELLTPRSA